MKFELKRKLLHNIGILIPIGYIVFEKNEFEKAISEYENLNK